MAVYLQGDIPDFDFASTQPHVDKIVTGDDFNGVFAKAMMRSGATLITRLDHSEGVALLRLLNHLRTHYTPEPAPAPCVGTARVMGVLAGLVGVVKATLGIDAPDAYWDHLERGEAMLAELQQAVQAKATGEGGE
jgi:hypothetical protein